MTVRLLDDNGDITTSGRQFTTGVDEIVQTVRTRLALFIGEYFRDITEGVPWWESILGKGGSLSTKEALIKNRIIRTEGVTQILEFSTSFDIDTRKYSVSAVILTAFGEAELTVTNG